MTVLTALVLCGCKDIEGHYVPDCAAFAGDTIVLESGRFTWDRFTDEVRVDEDGNHIDPFPGFPKSGDYVMQGDRLEMRVDGEDAAEIYHLQSHDGRFYLLTEAQANRYAEEGVVERCALVREAAPEK